jgi:hypothetical protein
MSLGFFNVRFFFLAAFFASAESSLLRFLFFVA